MRAFCVVIAVLLFSSSMALAENDFHKPRKEWDNGYYANASVGDFAEYANDKGEPLHRTEVVAVEDHKLIVVYSSYVTATRKNDFKQTWIFDAEDRPEARDKSKEKGTETVQVKAGKFACRVVETLGFTGNVSKTEWFSPSVPFDGLVQSKSFARFELSSYKYAKAPKEK